MSDLVRVEKAKINDIDALVKMSVYRLCTGSLSRPIRSAWMEKHIGNMYHQFHGVAPRLWRVDGNTSCGMFVNRI